MNVRKILVLFSAILITVPLINSCKKGRANFVLAGTINDGSLSTILTDVEITLWKTPAGTSIEEQIGSVHSLDGNYRFEFERDQTESYRLVVKKPNYFDINKVISFSELSIESDNIRNYTTYAKSWAKLHFVNVNPQPTDQLRFIKVKGKKNCVECCPDDYVDLFGVADTTIYCINDGNAYYSINYWVIGTSVSGSESIVTTPFDTTEILLEY